MRLTTLVLCAAALASGTAAADPKPVALSVTDVSAQLQPIAHDIEHCYLDRAAEIRGAGKLDLVLTITRKGAIESLAVKTPGLPVKLAKQIDACIRPIVEPVAFPARKTFTTATIPFFFQHTAAPGAGPQESCWDAAGCPSQKAG
jgi:hypothetical protein